MYHYDMAEWLAFFYLYCFGGWCVESAYVSIRARRWTNRGFLRGPFLPLYGTGALMMLLLSMPFRENLILVYFSGCIGATALEFVTGQIMEALFKVRYWDYSDKKFNLKGHICLGTTLAWGFLTVFLTFFLHRNADSLIRLIPREGLMVFVYGVSVCIAVDFALSFKTALDMQDVLVRLDKARTEVELMQKRLDVLIAVANDEIEKRLGEKGERRWSFIFSKGDLLEGMEERFLKIKEMIKKYPTAFMEEVKEELLEMRGKFSIQKERFFQLKNIRDFFLREMLTGNPSMRSERFKEALEELKKAIQDKRRR